MFSSKVSAHKVRFWLFTSLIVLAPLSKYPSFALPLFNFTSFRLGLYQLLAAAFIFLCLISIKPEFFKKNKLYLAGVLLILVPLALGGFWAIDTKRWLLLSSSIVSLLLLFLACWWYAANELTNNKVKLIVRLVLYFGIFYSILTIIQLILSTLTTESLGLLCEKCVKNVFGFPRVNLFTAEPLFLANSLIPFFFISLYGFIKDRSNLSLWSLCLVSVAIGLTFSRGAFFALGIGMLAFYISLRIASKISFGLIIKSFIIIFLSFVASFLLLIASASYTYRGTPNITYNTAQTMVEQLSLGAVNLPSKTIQPATQTTNDPSDDFKSPGLIEASTNERLTDAQLAIKAWSYNIKNLLLGVSPGNLGPFTVKNIEPSAPHNLTVYIFYILVIAELGSFGLIGLIIIFGVSIYKLAKLVNKKIAPVSVVLTILTAFSAQYFFFGSYINVVYIWAWLGISAGFVTISQKHLSKLFK